MFKFNKKYFITIIALLVALLSISYFSYNQDSKLPIIAIANYGPHNSLEESILGIKEELTRQGFVENQNIRYEIADVSFEPSLIGQMIIKLKSLRPKVMVVMTTPVAQTAKNLVKDIPLVFDVITDPVEAGLLKNPDVPESNITGAADKQDFALLLKFVKQIIPNANSVGVLYATSEANDIAMVKMLEKAAKDLNIEVMAVPINQARDIPIRVQAFKDKVDFIYVGVSGLVQPALPAIISEADKMHIPVFNADIEAVKKHQVLGNYGVNYYQTGVCAAQIIVRILKGEKVSNIKPIYPGIKDHHGFISKKKAEYLNIKLPTSLTNTTILE